MAKTKKKTVQFQNFMIPIFHTPPGQSVDKKSNAFVSPSWGLACKRAHNHFKLMGPLHMRLSCWSYTCKHFKACSMDQNPLNPRHSCTIHRGAHTHRGGIYSLHWGIERWGWQYDAAGASQTLYVHTQCCIVELCTLCYWITGCLQLTANIFLLEIYVCGCAIAVGKLRIFSIAKLPRNL